MMDEKIKRRLVSLVVIVFVIVISATLIYIKSINKNNPSEEIVKCISEKAVLYVQTGCSHCLKQKKEFGKYYGLLNVVDCTKTPEECIEAEIISVPTWVFNGTHIRGTHEVEELKEIMGC